MNTGNRITINIVGIEKDNGDLRFNDFIQQLDILKKVLIETQKLLSDTQFAYFKVIELQKNSPSQIVLEANPIKAEDEHKTEIVVEKFFASIDEINSGKYPEGFTYDTFSAYKSITSLMEKKRIANITISRNGDDSGILYDFPQKIDRIMGKDEYEYGSYSGMLEAINIHNQKIFYIYPTSNLPKLKCSFIENIKSQVISAIGKYVTIIGEKKFKHSISNGIPYEMLVHEIEVHPDQDILPSLKELRGIFPNATGGLSSEEFIRGIRGEQ